jgi:hypothetical protein
VIKEVKQRRTSKNAQEKTYVLMGDLFVRQSTEATEAMLVKDTSPLVRGVVFLQPPFSHQAQQGRLAQEIERLRQEINTKNAALNKLQGPSVRVNLSLCCVLLTFDRRDKRRSLQCRTRSILYFIHLSLFALDINK